MKAKEIQQHYSYLKRRSRSAYLTSLVSIALVLFFLGLFATLALFGQTFARYAQQSIAMKVFLHDGVGEEQLAIFQQVLASRPYVAEQVYISKEEAGKILMESTGEDILKLTDGINPLPASINLSLESPYIVTDSLQAIQNELTAERIVSDVEYPAETIVTVNQNVQIISFVFMLTGLILVFIALYLIMSTIRLTIYAQRMTIRSMQLIGATNGFIRRPFLARGISQGTLGGLIACGLLLLTLTTIRLRMNWLDFSNPFFMGREFIGILGGIVLFGTVLGLVGSYVAVNRFLHKNLDELI